MVSPLSGVRRFARFRPDLGLLSYGRVCDLRAAEQVFSSFLRLDIASRPATGDLWIKLWATCLVCLSHRLRARLYVQTRARRETRQVSETNVHRSPPSPAQAARHRPRLTWIARPASACAARCRYRVGLVIPLARMSSAMSAPSSGASRRAAQSAPSWVDGSLPFGASSGSSASRWALTRYHGTGSAAAGWWLSAPREVLSSCGRSQA